MNGCDRCKRELISKDDWTLDLWASLTLYDEEGKAQKTGEEDSYLDGEDYLVYCKDCAGVVEKFWKTLKGVIEKL